MMKAEPSEIKIESATVIRPILMSRYCHPTFDPFGAPRSKQRHRSNQKKIDFGRQRRNARRASSAPENRDRFPYASMEQTLFRTSIDRAIDRVKYSQRIGWPGLGRLFVTLIRIGGMSDPTRSLRLLVRYALFLLALRA